MTPCARPSSTVACAVFAGLIDGTCSGNGRSTPAESAAGQFHPPPPGTRASSGDAGIGGFVRPLQ